MNFEEQLIETMHRRVLNEVRDLPIIRRTSESRVVIPDEVMERLWASIDWNEVIDSAREQMQIRICNAVVGSMETEVKTDIKKLMSVAGVREKLRIRVYPELMKVLEGK